MRALACVVGLAVVAMACGGGGSSGAGSNDGGSSEGGGGGDDGSSSGGPDGSPGMDGGGQDASQDASMHADSSSGSSSGGDSGSGDAYTGDAAPDAPVWTGTGVLATGLEATSFATIGSTIYFGGTDAAHGNELWTTDITPQGTTLVYDGCPGTCDGYRGDILQVNGQTLFGAVTSAAPGTEQTMFMLPPSGAPASLPIATDGAWQQGFAGTNLVVGSLFGLSVTDGTAAGTSSILSALGTDHPEQVYGIGSRALVVAGEANTSPVVYELFGTDGTVAGTAKLETGNSTNRSVVAASNGKGYVLDESTLLTITDGTPAGTNDVSTTFQSLGSFDVLSSGTVIFYGAVGGTGGTNGLWASDGTTTTQIGPEGPTDAAVNLGSSAIFPSGSDLLSTDGTSAGTKTLMSFSPNYVRNIGAAGSYVYFYVVPFTAQAGVQPQLWKTDGTAGGTTKVADLAFCPSSGCSQSDFLMNGIASGNTLAFEITLISSSSTFSYHLWSTAGTAATTHVISDALPNPAFLPVGTGVLFSTTADDLRYEPL